MDVCEGNLTDHLFRILSSCIQRKTKAIPTSGKHCVSSEMEPRMTRGAKVNLSVRAAQLQFCVVV